MPFEYADDILASIARVRAFFDECREDWQDFWTDEERLPSNEDDEIAREFPRRTWMIKARPVFVVLEARMDRARSHWLTIADTITDVRSCYNRLLELISDVHLVRLALEQELRNM
jgi:hypothetical protein